MPKINLNEPDDDPALTKTQLLNIKKRITELNNPTRYVIASPMLRNWCFFYQPNDAVYIINRIEPNCLFKCKAVAQAVAKVLNGTKRKKNTQVIAVRKTPKGYRILEHVVNPQNPKEIWKPKLERARI